MSERHEVTNADIIAGRKKFENVSPAVNAVLVVANFPASDFESLQTLATVTSIENYGFTIEGQFMTSGVSKKTLMGKSDKFTSKPNTTPGDNDAYIEVDVELDALTARFEIGDVKPGTNVKNVKIEGVWINNFRNGNNATEPTLYPQNHSYWVIDPIAEIGADNELVPMTSIPEYTPKEYRNLYDENVNGTTNVYAFQLFAGEYVPHVILLVSGQDSNDKYFLGWLTYNKFLEGNNAITKVEKNVIYKVGLSGITVNLGDLTNKPEMKSVDLGIQCTITDWTVKNVTPSI